MGASIDDVITRAWSPRGVLHYAWRRDPAPGGGDELHRIMGGLQYVRKRVHHEWADALISRDAHDGASFPLSCPTSFGTVVR